MNIIKTMRIYKSEINYFNGKNIGPGFGIFIDPHPASEENIIRVTQAIRNALDGLHLEDE